MMVELCRQLGCWLRFVRYPCSSLEWTKDYINCLSKDRLELYGQPLMSMPVLRLSRTNDYSLTSDNIKTLSEHQLHANILGSLLQIPTSAASYIMARLQATISDND